MAHCCMSLLYSGKWGPPTHPPAPSPPPPPAGTQRLVIGLVGAMFMMLVEMLVFVTRSLKADEVLEAARQVNELK